MLTGTVTLVNRDMELGVNPTNNMIGAQMRKQHNFWQHRGGIFIGGDGTEGNKIQGNNGMPHRI